jgi:uncharacterized protein
MWRDCNAFFGHWPFRDLPVGNDPVAFSRDRAECAIAESWVSPLEAFFRFDPAADNERLGRRLAGAGGFRLLPVINPLGPATPWIEAVSCAPACRLAPVFHGYALDEPRVDRFIQDLDTRCGIVAVTVRLVDRRSQPPAFLLDDVPFGDVCALAMRHPGRRFLATGALLGEIGGQRENLPSNLFFETSFVDGLNGIAEAWKAAAGRLVFGSGFPLLYSLAACRKVDGSSLDKTDVERIAAAGSLDEATV